ncbi:MAG TPA: UDP-N-acetylmuramoyl-L-alanine--D-glutamate ligase [Bacillota bacterium]|nr:UDP-N-acetylmuramoyl-L-alanine--D-glutamate ligase [Bacillota bacterium]HPT87318.1 UDP-N-acetylmuramoyl-L-alanine--D-glutamate ligase [Bacillota bacterium]
MNERAVLGLGIENLALVKYLLARGEKVTVCDSREPAALGDRYHELKERGIQFRLGADYLDHLTDFTEVFRSPGLPLFDPRLERAKAAGVKITSAMRLFLELCPCKIIGVTGTKGKGTTSSLIHRILHLSQKKKGTRAFLGGNIGIAPFEFLEELKPDDVVILELSSFQLEDFDRSVDIAVITNITEDHLAPADPVNPNYHKSRSDYIQAKANLFRYQDGKGVTILNRADPTSRELETLVRGQLLTYGNQQQPKGAWFERRDGLYQILWNLDGQPEQLISSESIQVRGEHNLLNIAAAALASRMAGADLGSIRDGISGYQGLEHRLEYVATVNGVQFFDDSFATAPDPTIVGIRAFTEPIVLIAGGADKGADFTVLAEEVLRSSVKTVILIGVTGPKIGEKLQEVAAKSGLPIPELVYGCQNMTEIVRTAFERAAPGEVVLLSTACASFGMFKNYKERGNLFKEEVRKLMDSNI